MLGEIAEHGAQVLEIEQQQPLLVGDAEADVEHALLHLVEVHQPREQQRPHLRDGGADRMALLAEQIPEHHRKFVGLVGEAEALGARDKRVLGLARFRDAGEIALDVGGKHRHARAREALRQHLQGDGLAGAGRSGDQPVPVRQRQRQKLGLGALADEDFAVRVDVCHLMLSFSAQSEAERIFAFLRLRSTPRPGAYAEEQTYCSLGFPSANVARAYGTRPADASPLRSPGANRRLSGGGTDGRPARLLQQAAETAIKQPRRDAQRNGRDVAGPAGGFGQIGRDHIRKQQRGYAGSAARRCDLGGQLRCFVRNFRRQNDQASVGAGPIAHPLRFGMTGDNANAREPHAVDCLDQRTIGCRSANDNNTRTRKRHHATRPLLHGGLLE